MAKAEQKTVTVTKPVEEKVFVLTLTADEAAVVRAAVGSVVGNGPDGSSANVYSLYSALDLPGIPKFRTDNTFEGSYGSIKLIRDTRTW